VEVRVVAATNRVLEDLVEAGTFRSDLMYRLNLYTIHLSPLRDRQEDIPPAGNAFSLPLRDPQGSSIQSILRRRAIAAVKLRLSRQCPGTPQCGGTRYVESFRPRVREEV
jgi:transcriptional regulator with PAS, ATPase and Fis domain